VRNNPTIIFGGDNDGGAARQDLSDPIGIECFRRPGLRSRMRCFLPRDKNRTACAEPGAAAKVVAGARLVECVPSDSVMIDRLRRPLFGTSCD
jgi:hypothetical protein